MKLTNLTCGVLLLSNRMPALALAVLIPITVMIAWFHLALDPLTPPLVLTALVVLCEAILLKAYWANYRPMFGAPAHG